MIGSETPRTSEIAPSAQERSAIIHGSDLVRSFLDDHADRFWNAHQIALATGLSLQVVYSAVTNDWYRGLVEKKYPEGKRGQLYRSKSFGSASAPRRAMHSPV